MLDGTLHRGKERFECGAEKPAIPCTVIQAEVLPRVGATGVGGFDTFVNKQTSLKNIKMRQKVNFKLSLLLKKVGERC